jgi:hypothetical protein
MMIWTPKNPARAPVILFVGIAVLLGCGFLMHHVLGAEEELGATSSVKESSPPAMTASKTLHPVIIREPRGTPTVNSGMVDAYGNEVGIACVTCHATATPNPQINRGDQLLKFHQGLHFAHGNITCLSCHNAEDYNSLRLADSRRVEFKEVMQLCGQCHGHQLESYKHGAHGGMNGHWDLTRGSRTRNTCTNCHDPHAPKFPLVQPIFPPRDRISVPLPERPVKKTHEYLPKTP